MLDVTLRYQIIKFLVKLLTFNDLFSLFMAIIKILCGIDNMQIIRPMMSKGVNAPHKNWFPPLWLALPDMMTLKPPLPPTLFALPGPINITMTRHHN